ncbi:hypothetical protein SESBI_26917 [Sesbania bispinosa]|nr:hypothetical protein SESBI_26917 [Sesbania bispinosa]
MAMAMTMPLTLRNKLKTLCSCGDGWSYAISGVFIPGIPCKHSWVHSDSQIQEWNLTGQNICENDSGLHQQFSSGIKTIVVIPVKAWGVVQFGSKKKILERVDFLEQTQSLLMEIDDTNMPDMSGNAVLSLNCEDYDLNGLLASISSENSDDWNLKYAHDEHSKELRKVFLLKVSMILSLLNLRLMKKGKRLFSELGIEELLTGESNNNPFNSSDFEHVLSSNKRQMVEFSPMNRNRSPIHFANLDRPEARANLMQPVSDLDKSNTLLSKKDTFPKFQVGMLIDDRNSINIGKAVPAHPQKPEEPTKPTKKRARPGESTRPRPKDRQQIQDCIKELRGIIPNGGKCSIDSLLDRTIKYMLFLRSVVKYADNLKEPNEPKLIDQENGVVLKDNRVGDNKNCGVTWAFEVAQQTTVCPIIVEDMSTPGQMLIEMLCEEQGFFLEIVDIIRGFGLNILKAKMELRKNKLWSRFIVEANRHVTRIDVFWSLIHLLQQTNTSGVDSANKQCNVIDANIS